jgi:pimeloyl-ACP methyl ester carboxylesterase
MKKMLSDNALAWDQLGSLVYESARMFGGETVQVCLAPIVSSEQRIALFQQLSDWEKNRAQLVAVAPQLRAAKMPVQIIRGDADPVFDVAPSLDWLRASLGNLKKITRVPRAKLYFPEEHPRLMSVMLTEFWS